MSLKPFPFPTEKTLEAFKIWIRNDLYTWGNDRSTMVLDRKAETVRVETRKKIRQLSAAATIVLLKEERAKGKLCVSSGCVGSDPYTLDVYIGYLRCAHCTEDFLKKDLLWFEQTLIELIEELREHEAWPHYILQPHSLSEHAVNALCHFELADASTWLKFIEGDTNKRSHNNFQVSAFLAMAKRPRTQRLDDDRMSDFLVHVINFLGIGEEEDADFSFEVGWFEDMEMKSDRMHSCMTRWFNKARAKLPEKTNKQNFDRLADALHIEIKQS